MILAQKFAKAEHSAQEEQIANFVTKSHGFLNFAIHTTDYELLRQNF
jgi:hypothetical protein